MLTTGVNLWNAHLMGEEATGLPALRGAVDGFPEGMRFIAVWVDFDSCQSSSRQLVQLYDHAAVFFHFIF